MDAEERRLDFPVGGSTGVEGVNVLYIIVDDLRAELGFSTTPGRAQQLRTPNLDRLARESVVFDRAYAQQGICGPSRTSFLTGRRPDTSRVWNLEASFRTNGRGGGWTTLPEAFKEAGYNTASFGKTFHPHHPAKRDCLAYPEDCRSWSQIPYEAEHFLQADAERRAESDVPGRRDAFATGDGFATVERAAQNLGRDGGSSPAPVDEDAREDAPEDEGNAGAGLGLPAGLDAGCRDFGASGFNWAACRGPDAELVDGNNTFALTHWIKHKGNPARSRKPFFAMLGLHRPHTPWLFPERFLDALPPLDETDLPSPPYDAWPRGSPPEAYSQCNFLPDEDGRHVSPGRLDRLKRRTARSDEVVRSYRRAYRAAASWADHLVGRALQALVEAGLYDNTVVVVHSDHGFQLGEHGGWCKQTNFELVARVPLLVRVPWIPGKRTRGLAELVDVYPTLLDLALVPLRDPSERLALEGSSLLPLMTGLASPGPAAGGAGGGDSATRGGPVSPPAADRNSEFAGRSKFGPDIRNSTPGGAPPTRAQPPPSGWKRAVFSQYPRCPGYRDPRPLPDAFTCSQTRPEDFAVMGLSIRTDAWRYTRWMAWDGDALAPVWDAVLGEELYGHAGDDGRDLDAFENENYAGAKFAQLVQEDLVDRLRAGWRAALPQTDAAFRERLRTAVEGGGAASRV
jgi:arylsulfatase A-like enzyme